MWWRVYYEWWEWRFSVFHPKGMISTLQSWYQVTDSRTDFSEVLSCLMQSVSWQPECVALKASEGKIDVICLVWVEGVTRDRQITWQAFTMNKDQYRYQVALSWQHLKKKYSSLATNTIDTGKMFPANENKFFIRKSEIRLLKLWIPIMIWRFTIWFQSINVKFTTKIEYSEIRRMKQFCIFLSIRYTFYFGCVTWYL